MILPVHLLLCCCICSVAGETTTTESSSPSSYDESSTDPLSTTQNPCECCSSISDRSGDCECGGCQCCGFAMEFMVAAQIALGAALLLAVVALSFLIWKMCLRNSIAIIQGRNRVRAFCGLPELPRRSSASSSINSVQNFVIQKMRDRPPRYDESPPQMPPCYDDIVPSSAAHSSSGPPVTIYGPATLPLYEQIYPGTSREESSNAAAAAVGVERSVTATTETENHQCTVAVHSDQSNENAGIGETNPVLYDEACGGIVNPSFIPEIQEQHI